MSRCTPYVSEYEAWKSASAPLGYWLSPRVSTASGRIASSTLALLSMPQALSLSRHWPRASDVTGGANDHRSWVSYGLGADVQRRSARLARPTRIGRAGSSERTTHHRHHDNSDQDPPR
jgi:hypothetical protein